MAVKPKAWRMARALDQLLAQINAFAPKRSKVSDGGIGDAAHASRNSDHNPWHIVNGVGVVTARDFTHDPMMLDCNLLADILIRSADKRIKYIIWNKRIVSGTGQKQAAWKWRPYNGKNGHTKHLHISVKADLCDDATAWGIPSKPVTPASKPTPPLSPEAQVLLLPESDVLRAAYPADMSLSAFDRVVFAVQSHITKLGYPCGKIDGVAGALTAEALRAAQADNGLTPTGAVDVATVNGIMAWRHRIIAPERQNITPDKVAATVPEAKSNAWTRFWAKIGAWGGSVFTGGVGAAQLLEATGQAKTITDTVKDYLPSPSMLLLCAVFVAILVLVIRSTNKTEAEVTEAVRTAARR